MGSENARDLAGKVQVEQVANGQVDGNREVTALLAPALALGDRALEDVVGEVADQSGLLRDRE